jgi:multidrug resistance efflux pump
LPSRLRAELKIPALRWEVVAAEAALAEGRGQAVERTLCAPAGGAVVGIDVRRGAEPEAGQAVMTLSVPGRLQVLSEWPAAHGRDLAVGDRVQVVFDNGPPLPATIAALRPGRLVAGSTRAAADRDYITAHIVPCEGDPWPTIRDGSPVTVLWGCPN